MLRDLEIGGAQRQCLLLAKALQEQGDHVCIAVFYGGGEWHIAPPVSGVRVIALQKSDRWEFFGFRRRLQNLLEVEKPDVFSPILPGPCFWSIFVRRPGSCKMIWTVCSSALAPWRHFPLQRALEHTISLLSWRADAITYNAQAAHQRRLMSRFCLGPRRIIESSVDLARLSLSRKEAKAGTYPSVSIAEHLKVIGSIARIDPVKDWRTLIDAFALLSRRHDDLVLLLVHAPEAVPSHHYNEVIEHVQKVRRNTPDRPPAIHIVPSPPKVEAAYATFDVYVSSSKAQEGCPTVLLEAMASGVPVVATDVGESSIILAFHGRLVPAADGVQMADAIESALTCDPVQLQATAAAVCQRFSPQRQALAFQDLATVL